MLPVQTYNIKIRDPSVRHIGPMAQPFYSAFQVGEDNQHITTVDADGVAFAAIQGLNQKVAEKEARIKQLESRLKKLEQILDVKNGEDK